MPSKGFDVKSVALSSYFDWPKEIKIKFKHAVLDKPVRTKSGKLKLKITKEDMVNLNMEIY